MNKLKSIADNRTQLMGISAILILICHSVGNNVAMPSIISRIADNGQIGVDFFLFLSGLGLFFSLDKKPLLSVWYAKRLKRIYIPFLILAIPYLIYKLLFENYDVENVIPFLLNVSYFINGRGVWYLSLAILLYLFSPLLYVSINKKLAIGGGGICMIIALLCNAQMFQDCFFFIAFRRAPSFIVGMMIAKMIKDGRDIKWLDIILLLVCFVVCTVTLKYTYSRWLVVLPLLLILDFALRKLPCKNNALYFMETISLESYLTNIFLGDILNHKSWIICGVDLSYGHYVEYSVVIILGLILSYWVHKFSNSDKLLNHGKVHKKTV